jgi:CubicO group peptidase (beta-lactamase class C family)
MPPAPKLAAFLAASLCFAADPPFPNPRWPATGHVAGLGTSAARIASYDAWVRERAGARWAGVIIKGGYLVHQGRGPRSHVDQKHDCGSIKKSLQSTVLGAALLQGKLKSIDEIANGYWKDPYLPPHENDRAITFRQFAQYRDRWNEPEPPGTYRYNNSSAVAAGACIAGLFRPVSGVRPRGIAEVAAEHVMRRIEADWELWYWEEGFSSNPGNPGPRMVLESSVSELAKLGYLWLRKGRWKNTRIFSENYYREALTDWSPTTTSEKFGMVGHYGYWWFVNAGQYWLPGVPEDAFYHIGNGDPKRATALLVIPSHDTVAVLGMERLSDEGKWDVIQNSRTPTNDGMRPWARAVAAIHTDTP